MKQADLDAVREASREEREHDGDSRYWAPGRIGCHCARCAVHRVIIAKHMPALLALLDDALAIPRREHHDLGDLG